MPSLSSVSQHSRAHTASWCVIPQALQKYDRYWSELFISGLKSNQAFVLRTQVSMEHLSPNGLTARLRTTSAFKANIFLTLGIDMAVLHIEAIPTLYTMFHSLLKIASCPKHHGCRPESAYTNSAFVLCYH